MKLISCYIENFGCLHEVGFDFSDGLTCLCEENGYGKSTLAAFIGAIFYGLPDGRKRASENTRKKYLPWQGGTFGGNAVIETPKGRFRVTRTFGKKQAEDTFALTDLDTRLESREYGEDLGEELFGLSEESFTKSTYLPQDAVTTSMTPDINARLTNLLESSDDMSDYGNAVTRLEAYIRNLCNAQKHGEIPDLRAELTACMEEIERCEKRSDDATDGRLRLEEVAAELETLDTRTRELDSALKKAEADSLAAKDAEYCRRLADAAKDAKRKAAALASLFPSGIPTDGELRLAADAAARLDSLTDANAGMSGGDRRKLDALRARFGDATDGGNTDRLSAKAAELSARAMGLEIARTSLPEKPEKPKARSIAGGIVALAGGILLLVAGIILCPILLPLGIALCSLGALCAGAGAVTFALLRSKSRRDAAEYEKKLAVYLASERDFAEKASALDAESAALDSELASLVPGYRRGDDRYAAIAEVRRAFSEYQTLLADEKRDSEEKARRRAASDEIKGRLDTFFARCPCDLSGGYGAGLDRLRANIAALGAAERDATEKENAAKAFAAENGIDMSLSLPALPDTERLAREKASVVSRISYLEHERGRLTEAVRSADADSEALPALNEKADLLREKISGRERDLSDAREAKDFLERAKDSLSGRYLDGMEKAFSESFRSVSGLDLGSEIDTSLGLKLGDKKMRSGESYSRGLREIAAVCLRIALTDAIFTGDKPFLLLDDPFCDLDDLRLCRALEMTERLAEGRQIIYLTCHSSRVPKKG